MIWLYCYFGWIFPPERNQSVFMETNKHVSDVSNFPPIWNSMDMNNKVIAPWTVAQIHESLGAFTFKQMSLGPFVLRPRTCKLTLRASSHSCVRYVCWGWGHPGNEYTLSEAHRIPSALMQPGYIKVIGSANPTPPQDSTSRGKNLKK